MFRIRLILSLAVLSFSEMACERSGVRPPSDMSAGTMNRNSAALDRTGSISGGGTGNRDVTTLAPSVQQSPTSTTAWLHTERNRILTSDGKAFHGRGANIFDTRQCKSCSWAPPHVNEVIRRVDELVDVWHANFMRLALTSFAGNKEKGLDLVQWGDVLQDASYFNDLKRTISHIDTKPGVYVMITLFAHPSLDEHGLPTQATIPVYKKLAETFKDDPHVLYGVCNEPHDTTDETVWAAMNLAVDAIRSVESADGPQHLVAVQGTQNYSRNLGYYLGKRIAAGNGKNVIYETHAYNPPSDWQAMFLGPAHYLPVIIGEFGPVDGYMKLDDTRALMAKAEEAEIPYLAWSFSPECMPGLIKLADNPTDCGEGLLLSPSEWGAALRERLAHPW